MPETLQSLEKSRADILRQMAGLGDFRAGSITSTQGRCGKSNCCCREPDHPGHGPHLRLTYKVEKKTISESLPDAATARKAEHEVAEFRKFQQLSRQFVEVNAQICRLRPVDETLSREEKKRRKPSKPKSLRK
jgi:hypothetical protein